MSGENSFKSATENILRQLGYFTLVQKLSTECVIDHEFFGLPELQEGCILGLDFFLKYKTKKIKLIKLLQY